MAKETYEELQARHRKEQRELVATVTSLKKSATKGEKRKKKEVLAKCEQMERDLAARHFAEVQAFEEGGEGAEEPVEKEAEEEEEEEEEEVSTDQLLAQLSLAIKTTPAEDSTAASSVTDESESGRSKSKKNRQKDRLARRKAAQEELSAAAAAEAAQTPDLRKIEMENVRALTEKLGLVEYDITPDGHCLFASLADQLAQRHKIKTTISELRKRAADHMRTDPDTFTPFMFDEATLTMRELEPYCAELESTAIWGGDMEILAIAREFDCPVNVVMSGRARMRMNEDGKKAELWVAFYKHSYGLGEHYNSLRDRT
ncbi:hypothetical protein BZA70DRAFT_272049 [Myxozyma melibiosi]|uniref:OTU domain-containing protein n=1 Tax=Myxozyma melibiosi TaxID=54550 RepID=A0ABR1FD17_9ASCO